MQLLGQIGIDFKLLLAQMANFALLLIILGKFVYRPIIRKIEEDERKLKRAQTKEKELEREKSIFAKKKEEETAKIKLKSKEAVKEAEKIAQSIKKQAAAEAKQLRINLLGETREELEEERKDYKASVEKLVRDKTIKKIHANLAGFIGGFKDKNLLDALFESLVINLERADIRNIKGAKLIEGLTKISSKGQVKKLIRKKIGRIILEYSNPISRKQEDKLIKILAGKIGVKPEFLKIDNVENKNLLIGFRLEIAGFIFENSLSGLIKDAV